MRIGDCKNFTGIMKDECEAGVIYRELSGTEAGMMTRIPCLISHKNQHCIDCRFYKPISQQDIDQRKKDTDKYFSKVMPAVIKLKVNNKPGDSGKESCPICGNAMHWQLSSCNGHLHAQCETKDCVKVME